MSTNISMHVKQLLPTMDRRQFITGTILEIEEANRSPIEGYENSPILSLEKAVEQVISSVPHVLDYVVTAKKERNKKTSLTIDQSAALYLYTMPTSFFLRLNEALRAENRHALKPWFSYLKLFMSALEQLPFVEEIIWRGVEGDAASTLTDGCIHIWWSINSFTKDVSLVEKYLGDKGTVFAIKSVRGKDISAFSAFPDEKEVILIPGAHVRAKDYPLSFPDNRYHLVHLVEENLQSESKPASNHLFQKIRQKYLENAFLKCLINPAETFPIEQCYINLTILEKSEQLEKEQKLGNSQFVETLLNTFEEIYRADTSINIEHIFEKCIDNRKQVLVFGRAGIGKTTFCQYVTYQWAKGAFWQEYDLIVFIRLRNLLEHRYQLLTNSHTYTLSDVIKREYFDNDLTDQEEKLLKEELKNRRILWLLDGYEEIIQNIPEHLKYLLEQLLNTPYHIIASRPYLNTLSHKVRLEITGFIDDNINKYVKQFFEHFQDKIENSLIQGQRLLQFLKLNVQIWGIAHIPVNLEIMCNVWYNIDWSERTLVTMTDVYDEMVTWLFRRYLEKKGDKASKHRRNAVYKFCSKELAFLESLAFLGMKENTIILQPKLLTRVEEESECSLDDNPQLLNIGILKPVDSKRIDTCIDAEKSYYFVHLSFQEFFAARYIAEAFNSGIDRRKQVIDFIKYNKYNQRFELVFTFLTGLLKNNGSEQSITLFWDTILGEPLDLIGVRHTQLMIACIEETACDSSLPRFQQLIKSIVQWIKYFVTEESDHRHIYIKASLKRRQKLVNQPEIFNTLKNLYENSDARIKKNAYFFICGLPILTSNFDLTSLHLAALDDNDTRVQDAVCEALEEMNEIAVTDDTIDRLIRILLNSKERSAKNAANILLKLDLNVSNNIILNRTLIALGKRHYFDKQVQNDRFIIFVKNILTGKSIYNIVSAFRNEDEFIRCGICRTIAYMSEKLNSIEIIEHLATAVVDESDNVKQNACYALKELGERAACPLAIENLLQVIQDRNKHIRKAGCEALGSMGEKVAHVKVIDSLIIATSDCKDEVKQRAYYALGQLAGKTETNRVLETLANGLQDKRTIIRQSACESLGKLGKMAANPETIKKLIDALKDEDETIRWSACIALGKLGEVVPSSEVIKGLSDALKDVSDFVKSSACESFGRIGQSFQSFEVLEYLSTALKDANEDVRYVACTAIGQIGKISAEKLRSCLEAKLPSQNDGSLISSYDTTTEVTMNTMIQKVIILLITVLEDSSYDVTGYAYDMLEKICTKEVAKDIVSILITELEGKDPQARLNASKALSKIGQKVATIEVISSLTNVLENGSEYLKIHACEIFGQISDNIVNEHTIMNIANAFINDSNDVKRSACNALGRMGRKAANDKVKEGLMHAIQSENSDVKCSAYKAIGQIYRNTATKDITDSLINAVRTEKTQIRQSACYALGEVSREEANYDVIKALIDALDDAHPDVQNSASEALLQINYTAGVREVISSATNVTKSSSLEVRINKYKILAKIEEEFVDENIMNVLITAVFDSNASIKSIACEALGKIKVNRSTDYMIDGLINALKDESYEVRWNACEALKNMTGFIETSVIDSIIDIARNDNPIVRSTACFALYNVCKKKPTDNVIDYLIQALGDKSDKVMYYAYDALESVCTNNILGKFMYKLMAMLQNENYEIRWKGCQLLGKIGEEAATNEVIYELLCRCVDTDSAVRYAAHEAVENIFPLCANMSCLTEDTISKLSSYITKSSFRFFRQIPPHKFVTAFLETGIQAWIPVIKTVLLRQGYGITITENIIVLHTDRESIKLSNSNTKLCKQLKDGLSS